MIVLSVLNNKRLRIQGLRVVCLGILLLSLVACIENPLRKDNRALPTIEQPEKVQVKNEEFSKVKPVFKAEAEAEAFSSITEIQRGEINYLGSEQSHITEQISVDDNGVNLNFQNLDLKAFVQAVLGDTLKKNYLIDSSVAGTVTIQTVYPLPEADLLDVFQEILSLNGATMVLKDGYYRVLPVSKAAQLPMVSRVKRLKNQGYGLQIVPLQFIGATEMAQILQPTMKAQGVVYTDKRRNLLILSGSEALLTSMVDMITIFDVDWLTGKSISLFSLRFVKPTILIQELESTLDGMGGELFGGMVKLVPIERINSILIVSSSQKYMQELAIWVKRLDVSNDKAEKRLFVYNLKNTKAIDIANTLTQIFTNNEGGNNNSLAVQVIPTDHPVTLTTKSADNSEATASGIEDSISFSEQSDIKIIPDEVSNTLVIMGTSRDYEMVESAIRKLDVLPKQVLVEATIIEVSLTGDLSFGVEWFFKNGVGSGKTGQGQFSLGEDGIAALSGFSYSVIDSATDVRFVLNALEARTNVQLLSSPSIMVLDNNSATINVGDEIPIPTRQSNSNVDPTAPTVNEIEYRNTGILLTISPQINEGGLVTLEVNQEVSDAITTQTSGIDAPTIQQRKIESTVAIQSGQSVILGGLIRDKKEDSQSGVPVLSQLPLVGNIFRQTLNSDRRTELLVILTPHVIANPSEAREITNEFRVKLARPVEL